MKNTQNLNLDKPDGSDLVKVSDLNKNWDTLDGTIGAMGSLETITKNSIVGALNEVNSRIGSSSGGTGGSYVLPKASTTVLGGVKVGSGVGIDLNGVLSTNNNAEWAKDIVRNIGDLSTLTTSDKRSVVKAINEIKGYVTNPTQDTIQIENPNSAIKNGKYAYVGSLNMPSNDVWLIDVTIQDGGRIFQVANSVYGSNDGNTFTRRSGDDLVTQPWTTWVKTNFTGDADTVDGKHASDFFEKAKSILVNADLNNYTAEGFYYCSSSVDVGTMKNAPFPNTAFSLIVLRNAGCTQIATTYKNNLEAVKMRNEFNNMWGTWKSIVLDTKENGKIILKDGVNIDMGGRKGALLELVAHDQYGSGVGLSAGGLTVVGGGESVGNYLTKFPDGGNAGTENLALCADGSVIVRSNVQSGFNDNNKYEFKNGDIFINNLPVLQSIKNIGNVYCVSGTNETLYSDTTERSVSWGSLTTSKNITILLKFTPKVTGSVRYTGELINKDVGDVAYFEFEQLTNYLSKDVHPNEYRDLVRNLKWASSFKIGDSVLCTSGTDSVCTGLLGNKVSTGETVWKPFSFEVYAMAGVPLVIGCRGYSYDSVSGRVRNQKIMCDYL